MGRLQRWLRRLAGDRGRGNTAAGQAQPDGGAARLRADIDSGRTGDKVAASDPAAAPLGTDAEAAGTPPTADEANLARRQERKG